MTHASVVGITFCDIKNHMDVWNKIKPGMELLLEREPDNPKDKNAVKVFFEGIHIGYVERDIAKQLSAGNLFCKVVGIYGTPFDRPILAVDIRVRK